MLQKLFQTRKMATKRVPRAPILVSTPELAIISRGESASDHPGARGGPKMPENRPEKNPTFLRISKKYVYVFCLSPSFCRCSSPRTASAGGRPWPPRRRRAPTEWPLNGPPGHGFQSRPLKWLSFFAENPFLATPRPGEARKVPKIAPKIAPACRGAL